MEITIDLTEAMGAALPTRVGCLLYPSPHNPPVYSPFFASSHTSHLLSSNPSSQNEALGDSLKQAL